MTTKGIGLLFLPIYTRYLSPEEYGIINVLVSIVSITSVFISLYLDTAYERFFFEAKSDRDRKRLFSTLLAFLVVWGTFVIVVSIPINKVLVVNRMQIPFFPYIPIVMILSMVNQIVQFGRVLFRCRLQAKATAFIAITSTLVGTGLTVVLLIGFDMGVMARLLGALATAFIALFFYGHGFLKSGLIKWEIDFGILRQSLWYSLPLLPRLITMWIISASDRILLAWFGTLADTGIYSVAYAIGSSLLIFENAIFNFVYNPIMFSMLVENRHLAKQRISGFLRFYSWLFVMLALTLSLFSKEILVIMAERRFAVAYSVVPIVAFAYVFGALQKPFNQMLRYHKATWLLSAGSILQSIINLGFNILLIPLFGMVAAAWTTLGAFLFFFIWVFFWAQRYDRLQISPQSAISITAIVVLCIVSYLLLDCFSENIFTTLFLKMVITIIAVMLSFVLPVFTLEQRRHAYGLISNYFRSS